MEPCRESLPDKEFINEIKKISKKNNCVLIFDEITSGFRLNSSGAYKQIKVIPDIVVYGKTIANGIPMGAIVGKKKIMENSLKTFISSVFWSEKLGPACALTFIKKHKKNNVSKKLILTGKKIKKIWIDAAKQNNLEINITGIDPLASFKLKTKNKVGNNLNEVPHITHKPDWFTLDCSQKNTKDIKKAQKKMRKKLKKLKKKFKNK